MKKELSETEIEKFIGDAFGRNYEILRLEGGHPLSPDLLDGARDQVREYWNKLKSVAEKVTDTEVKLSLPSQKTPKGREFSIEGVVDIVREGDRTVMYDIKSQEDRFVHARRDLYERQLNVYAHIWQTLRKQRLDEIAIIATGIPESVRTAPDDESRRKEYEEWNPLVDIPMDQRRVDETIRSFSAVIDAMEDGEFSAPAVQTLKRPFGGPGSPPFAARICHYCDARYSCGTYRQYAGASGRGSTDAKFRKYIRSLGDSAEVENRTSALVDKVT